MTIILSIFAVCFLSLWIYEKYGWRLNLRKSVIFESSHDKVYDYDVSNLKPCPFNCNGKLYSKIYNLDHVKFQTIICTECNLEMTSNDKETIAGATKEITGRWNTRRD
jgi:hypothetical protein